MVKVLGVLALVSAALAAASAARWPTLLGQPPLLLGHRGDPSVVPEHTVASYSVAAPYVDYLEPDLVLTKDKVLFVHHDITLSGATDVESRPEFADRRRNVTLTLDGEQVVYAGEFFVSDFTLAELLTLRGVQRNIAARPSSFDGLFPLVSFDQFLDTVSSLSKALKKPIGIVPELKGPAYHAEVFGSFEFFPDLLLSTLEKRGYPIKGEQAKKLGPGGVIIQCFEPEALKYLRPLTDIPFMQLTSVVGSTARLNTLQGLREVSSYAQIISPSRDSVFSRLPVASSAEQPQAAADSRLVLNAHSVGLYVIPYTFSQKAERDPEYDKVFRSGVDGVFCEGSGDAFRARAVVEESLKCENEKKALAADHEDARGGRLRHGGSHHGGSRGRGAPEDEGTCGFPAAENAKGGAAAHHASEGQCGGNVAANRGSARYTDGHAAYPAGIVENDDPVPDFNDL